MLCPVFRESSRTVLYVVCQVMATTRTSAIISDERDRMVTVVLFVITTIDTYTSHLHLIQSLALIYGGLIPIMRLTLS